MKAVRLGLFIAGLLTLLYILPGVAAVPSINNCFNDTRQLVINVSSEMNASASLKSNGTCLTIGADNLTLDCAGATITFGINLTQSGDGTAFGINISNRRNITLRSCIFQSGDQNNNISGAIGINVTNSSNITLINITIVVNASGSNHRGVFFQGVSGSYLLNASIRVHNGTNSSGLYFLNSSNNTVNIANISANGSIDIAAIRIDSDSHSNSINNTNLSADGNRSFSIHLAGTVSANNGTTFRNTRLELAMTSDWMNISSVITLANTTFAMSNGTINFQGTLVTSLIEVANRTLNISPNRAYVNVSAHPIFNSSARISLYNIRRLDPAPLVNFTDTPSGDSPTVFKPCRREVCTEINNNESGFGTYVVDVTRFSTYSTGEGLPNITLTKSDSQDPVVEDALITYTINVTNNGTGNATLVNLTDTYPSLLVFDSTNGPQVVPTNNNTFVIGNLTVDGSSQFTVTLRVGSVNNLTIINNVINVSYTNSSGALSTFNITETTNVTDVATSTGGSSSGGGGGGGGASVSPAQTMTTDTATFTLQRLQRVSLRSTNILHTITVLAIYTDRVLIRVSSTPQEFAISNGQSKQVDFEKDGIMDIRITVVSLSPGSVALRIERLYSSCVESWSCDAWSTCASGQQTRTCFDAKTCGTTALKPAESQTCTAPASAPQEEEYAPAAPEPAPLEEKTVAEPVPFVAQEPEQGMRLQTVFYGLAALALVILVACWYFMASKKRNY